MLKMRKENGRVYIYEGERKLCFGEGIDGIRRAIQYVDIKLFLARAERQDVLTRLNTTFPVRSLVPANVGKTVKYTITEGEE
ncbi:MAG: hypothetical protein IKL79_01155 [Clostridia bacterium]|nr:hypothetical protein [Clostridia bacterium]